MAGPLGELVSCWMAWGGIDARLAPDPAALGVGFPRTVGSLPARGRSASDRGLGGAARLSLARTACGPG